MSALFAPAEAAGCGNLSALCAADTSHWRAASYNSLPAELSSRFERPRHAICPESRPIRRKPPQGIVQSQIRISTRRILPRSGPRCGAR